MLDYATNTHVGDLYIEDIHFSTVNQHCPRNTFGDEMGWENYNQPVEFEMRGQVLSQNTKKPLDMDNMQLLFVTGKYCDQEAFLIKTIMDDPGLLYKVLRDLNEKDLAREVLAKITD